MIITLLTCVIVLQFLGSLIQAVGNAKTKARNISLKKQVDDLKQQSKERESNKTNEAIASPEAGPAQPHR